MPENVVPLISSSVMGPLGIAHLPRLWLKILLHACGRLPEGYRHGNGGMDEGLCVQLGIDVEAMVRYVETERPDYLQFETWVARHATKLDAASVAAHNLGVLTRNMGEALAGERRARFGIASEDFANAIRLNDLDDWASVHAALTAVRSDQSERPSE
jgi:hypothetical protein